MWRPGGKGQPDELVAEGFGVDVELAATVDGKGRVSLTAREWEVVELLLRAATTSEIAEELGVAAVTVRRHLGSVERKLGVATRAEVVQLLTAQQPAA